MYTNLIKLFKTQIGRVRIIGFIEGLSFLVLLFVTMPLKYLADMPEPNKVFGMIHGLLFVLYVFYTFQAKVEYDWTWQTFGLAFLASIFPFGTFWADAKIFKKYDTLKL